MPITLNKNTMTEVLSVLTIIAQIEIVILLILMYLNRKKKSKLFKKIIKISDMYAFLIAIISTLGSLYYSEIAGFTPCKLCWFQRILMYPLVVILFVGIRNKDNNVSKYVLPIAGMGTLLAAYHYFAQIGVLPQTGCLAIGYSESCSKLFFMNFGYITIPMMSLTAFLFIFLLQIVSKKR